MIKTVRGVSYRRVVGVLVRSNTMNSVGVGFVVLLGDVLNDSLNVSTLLYNVFRRLVDHCMVHIRKCVNLMACV